MMTSWLVVMAAWLGQTSEPIDEFLTTLAGRADVAADVRAFVLKDWNECEDCDAAAFLVEALSLISPPFAEAMAAYDAGDMKACAERMAALAESNDPFLAVHAALYQAKALVALNDTVAAAKVIDALLADAGKRVARYSYAGAEVDFLRVYCLVQDLQFGAAERELEAFLQRYPDVPQRLTVSANQMLAEIRNRQAGRIGEVTDLMTYAAGRLGNGDSGDVVQERQKKAVELLEAMIKDAEEAEKNAANSGGGGGSNRGSRSPNSPMPDSSLPQGQAQPGALKETRRANPAESWGAMPPAEREKILQALQESFPRRYRRLVEQYYEQLAKEPGT